MLFENINTTKMDLGLYLKNTLKNRTRDFDDIEISNLTRVDENLYFSDTFYVQDGQEFEMSLLISDALLKETLKNVALLDLELSEHLLDLCSKDFSGYQEIPFGKNVYLVLLLSGSLDIHNASDYDGFLPFVVEQVMACSVKHFNPNY